MPRCRRLVWVRKRKVARDQGETKRDVATAAGAWPTDGGRACICAPPAQLSRKVKAQRGNLGEGAVDDITSRKTVKQFKWVGTRPVRPDGVPKVTGLAQYGADLAMPGMLVGRILRSPHAHARIRSIDASKAAALPGVKAVVTAADFPEQTFAYVGPERVAAADEIVEMSFKTAPVHQAYIEPQGCVARLRRRRAGRAVELEPGALYTEDRTLPALAYSVFCGPSAPEAH